MKKPPREPLHLPRDAQRLAAEACVRLLPAAERQAAQGKPSLLNAILAFLAPRESALRVQIGPPPPQRS